MANLETLRDELRVLMQSPQSLPDYWADQSVQLRVGRVLAGASGGMNGSQRGPEAVLITAGINRMSPYETRTELSGYEPSVNIWPWVVWFGAVVALLALAYWRFS